MEQNLMSMLQSRNSFSSYNPTVYHHIHESSLLGLVCC